MEKVFVKATGRARAKDGEILHVRVKAGRTFPDKTSDKGNNLSNFSAAAVFWFAS